MDTLARARYAARSKSLVDAYIFWFLLSPLGAHRLFLGKRNGLILPALLLAGFILNGAGFGVGVGLIGAGLLWVFADGFLIPGMVKEYNRQLARSLTRS